MACGALAGNETEDRRRKVERHLRTTGRAADGEALEHKSVDELGRASDLLRLPGDAADAVGTEPWQEADTRCPHPGRIEDDERSGGERVAEEHSVRS